MRPTNDETYPLSGRTSPGHSWTQVNGLPPQIVRCSCTGAWRWKPTRLIESTLRRRVNRTPDGRIQCMEWKRITWELSTRLWLGAPLCSLLCESSRTPHSKGPFFRRWRRDHQPVPSLQVLFHVPVRGGLDANLAVRGLPCMKGDGWKCRASFRCFLPVILR